MLRGCLLALVLWAALSYGYYVWVGEIFAAPASFIAPIVVGFLTMCCLGAWGNAWTAWRDAGRLRRAQDGTPPREGQVIAVTGPIQPLQQALPTPFTHRPSVLCEYDIQRPAAGSSDTSPGSYFAGFMMIPSAIQTERGPVPLLGFPLVDKYEEVLRRDPRSSCNAREFLRNTTFEDRSGLKMVTTLSIFGELWSDEDGMIFKNLRFTKKTVDDLYPPALAERLQQAAASERAAAPIEESDEELEDDLKQDLDVIDPALQENSAALARPPRLIEKFIPVGQVVTVFGTYQELRGGIGPSSRSGKPSRLFRCSAAEQEKNSRATVMRNLLGGAIAAVLIHAILYGVILLYQNSPDGKRHREQREKKAAAVAVKTMVGQML